jgi:multidrug efflux pump subunit AcrB
VPISLLPGTAGRLFREFGFVLAFSVAISAFVSLSLIPPMAARLVDHGPVPKFLEPVNAFGRQLAAAYDRALRACLDHPWIVIGAALASAAGAMALYAVVTKELVPAEDRGVVYLRANGPDGANLDYANRQAHALEDLLQPYVAKGEIQSLYTIAGRGNQSSAQITATLAPWNERDETQQKLLRELEPKLNALPGARMRAYGGSSLNIRGGDSGSVQVQLLGTDYQKIYEAAKALADRVITQFPNLSNPEISYQPTQPQLSVNIDRQRAVDLGIPLPTVSQTLEAVIQGSNIVDLNVGDQAIPIMLEARHSFIRDPGALNNVFVRSSAGALIPLSSIVSLKEEGIATQLNRYQQSRGIQVQVQLAAGYPLQSAVNDLKRAGEEVLPPDITMIFGGSAQTLQETSHDVALTYIFALVIVLLVLIAQFENLTSAFVIVITIPFGVGAAIYALFLTGTSVNIYSQIGLVMLIGLMAKNGILLVEFADQLRDGGLSVRDAVVTAARVRLRPITMTMLCTVLGGVPLIISGGPGSEARAAIGWVIFGGLGLAAVFTLFLAPVVYTGIARLSKARAEEAQLLAREMEDADAIPDRDTQAAE